MEGSSTTHPGATKKQLMEDFVRNLKGTTMLENNLLMTLVPVLAVLRQVLGILLDRGLSSQGRAFKLVGVDVRGASTLAFDAALDFVVIVLPTVAAMTLLSDHLCVLLMSTVAILGVLISAAQLICRVPVVCATGPSKETEHALLSSRKPYLSSYRAVAMLTSLVAILAVDFRIFPRRFAKAETFGTGLMDVGVGFFVCATALVSKPALGLPPPRGAKALSSFSPLLLLGFARLVLTKGVDYQEHVGEYGVHWNFFFTLAAVALATSAVQVPPQLSGNFGLALLTGYQALLSLAGWSKYIMSEERNRDLFSLNKEGILSILGYWALYLLSLQMGRFVHLSVPGGSAGAARGKANADSAEHKGKRCAGEWWMWAFRLFLLDALLWAAAVIADAFVERVSRRSCNMAYVLWTLANNLQAVAIFALADVALRPRPVLTVRALDANMLAVFLLGNILTGLVNLSVDTLDVPSGVAFGILSLYMLTITIVPLVVHKGEIKVKFW